jgi:hypothetical protein
MAAKKSLKTFSSPTFEDRFNRLSDQDWQCLEKLWNVPLSIEARDEVETASRIYAMVGPPHRRNAITVVKSEKALNNWLKACGRLRLALGATKTSASLMTKAEVIERFYGGSTIRKIGKMQPLTFFKYVMEAAMGAGLLAIEEKKHPKLSSALEKDLRHAWVAYLAYVVEQAGAKVSAASSNETNKESPFVNLVR